MAYNTGNPIGSRDARDFADNAVNLDDVVNADKLTFIDRLGKHRKTLAGMQAQVDAIDTQAQGYAQQAQSAAEVSGVAHFVDTKAAMDAAASGYANGAIVEVLADETRNGMRVRYQKSGGVMVFKLMLDTYQRKEAGAVVQSIRDKFCERVSIRDFGGRDDWDGSTGTNIHTALNRIRAAYPNGVTVHFPKMGTGVYRIDGTTWTDGAEGYTLDIDAGVTFSVNGGPFPIFTRGVRANRGVMLKSDSGIDFNVGKNTYRRLDEKDAFLAPELDRPVTSLIDARNLSFVDTGWNSWVGSAFTPPAVTSDTVTFTPGWMSAALCYAPARPGDQFQASFAAASFTGDLIAGVMTDAGLSIVRQNTTGGSYLNNNPSPRIGPNKPALDTAGVAYNFANALVAVRIHSARSYSVLCNGVEVLRVEDAGGNILGAGFGGAINQNAGQLQIYGWSKTNGLKTMGTRPLKVVTVGDSITDGNVWGNWPDYMRQYLAGFCGAQFADIKNIASSGQTSLQQLWTLQNEAINGYDYALILVGTNDIQMEQSATDMVNNILAMVTYCRNAGVKPIVGIQPIWYGQVQSGGKGVATSNYEKGAVYRAAMIRALGNAGVDINYMTMGDMGAVIAQWRSIPGADSVVVDNIHPTAYGRMLLGFAWAKALAAQLAQTPNKTLKPAAIPAAWLKAGIGGTRAPNIQITGDMLSFVGDINFPASSAANTQLFTLPEIYRPLANMLFTVPAIDGATSATVGMTVVNINSSGIVSLALAASAGVTGVHMGGVQYQIGGA